MYQKSQVALVTEIIMHMEIQLLVTIKEQWNLQLMIHKLKEVNVNVKLMIWQLYF